MASKHLSYAGWENQWIWAVVSKFVDTKGPNLHIGCDTLICIFVARGVYMFMAFMPYLATIVDLLMTPNVNGVKRLYISSDHHFLTDWIALFVASNPLDKIGKRKSSNGWFVTW